MLTIKLILQMSNSEDRFKIIKLLCLVILMAILDVAGVASVMPFMAVLGNQEIINNNFIILFLFETATEMGASTNTEFLLMLGMLNLLILLTSFSFKAYVTHTQMKFVYMHEASISANLVRGYLNQPYLWFVDRNSADIAKNVLSEVQAVITGSLLPLVVLIAHGAVAFALMVLLVIVNPLIALFTGLSLAIVYLTIYGAFSAYLEKIGVLRVESNKARFKAIAEAFGAIKDVKIANLEHVYARRFSEAAVKYASNLTVSQLIAQLPRFLVEGIAFGGIMALVLAMIFAGKDLGEILPIVGVYVFAGYRLMPALQNIYTSLTQLRFSGPALANLCSEFGKLNLSKDAKGSSCALGLEEAVELRNVSFAYNGAKVPVLNNLSIYVQARSTVAFVGPTGCGKTTLIDIMLGLLEPKSGGAFIDGVRLDNDNSKHWRRSVGYVPQQIFLADTTVSENIAFGIPPADIDQSAIERAAKIANIHSFVVDNTANGYATIVGERGVRLSGGQKQRIGIARALYHSPEILIFDEATSSLDGRTEKIVMEAVKNLRKKVTIIIIAHRLKTVQNSDNIFFFSGDGLLDQGTYDDLKARNPAFKTLSDLA